MDNVTMEFTIPQDIYLTLRGVGLHKDKLEEELKEALAISLYQKHILSLGKAAHLAKRPLADFMDLLVRNGIPVVEYTDEDYRSDLQVIEELG